MLPVSLVLSLLFTAASPGPCAQGDVATPDRRELGFEAGKVGDEVPSWAVPTQGWRAELTDSKAAVGSRAIKLFKVEETDVPFGNVMCYLDATDYRGRSLRLSARVRVEGAKDARAQMWLRADCEGGRMGAFDNMGDRPIAIASAADSWEDALIELVIDADAENLAIGVIAFGDATVFVDAVTIEASGAALPAVPAQPASSPAALAPRGVENLAAAARLLAYVRFFHPSDAALEVKAWGHAAIFVLEAAEPATDAVDLAARLQRAFAVLAPTLSVWAGGEEDAPALPAIPKGATRRLHWRHLGAGNLGSKARNIYSSKVERRPIGAAEDARVHAECFVVKDLGGGVSCRLPVQVYSDGKHSLPHANDRARDAAWSTTAGPQKLNPLNRSTRLASVALCWGVMQHFYPYFDVVATDWDAALTSALRKAATDTDERQFLFTLRELIAKLHDGHGNVYQPDLRAHTVLPLALAWAGEDLVVAGVPAGMVAVKVGDVVLSLDGKSTADCYSDIATRISAATEGWRRAVALQSLSTYFAGKERLAARLRRADGKEYDTTIDCPAGAPMVAAAATKPADGAELEAGIVYFDLNGAETAKLNAHMATLAAAKGIVFDLRGYPGSAGYDLMLHLIDSAATSAQWNVPIITRPDQAGWTWQTSGWKLRPVAPRLRGHIAFLTGGGAISYAESIMGIVEHYKMGEIVGATTAGTNGNVNPFELPGGYMVSWTGMKVLKHDGTRHHGVGIAPTVPVEPTAQGIAAGKDEVLERAVEVLRAKIAAGDKAK